MISDHDHDERRTPAEDLSRSEADARPEGVHDMEPSLSTFAAAVTAAALRDRSMRPYASDAVVSVLLDRAGATPWDIEQGRLLVHVEDPDVEDALNSLAVRLWPDRYGVAGNYTPDTADTGIDIVIADTEAIERLLPWQPVAGERGAGILMFTCFPDQVHPAIRAWSTKTVTLSRVDQGDVIPDVVELVTGHRPTSTPRTWEGIRLDDIRTALGPREGCDRAVELMAKLRDERQAAGAEEKAGRAMEEAEPDEAGQERGVPSPKETAATPVERGVFKLSDMHGFGEAGAWGMRLAKDLSSYARGQLPWSDVDRGVLLVGPPGSGKSTYAQALALECGVDLVVSLYSDWTSASGSGDSVTRGLSKSFDGWRKRAAFRPFVLFVDEIDSIGRRGGNGHNESWFAAIINAWLAFLDGATPRVGIVVVGATNNLDRVDPALYRPGRLDRVIQLPYPGPEALAGIVRHHLGPDAAIDEVELRAAAKACRGMSPADIQLACREARSTCRHVFGGRRVAAQDVADLLRARRMQRGRNPIVERITAIHEGGHAVAAVALGMPLDHVDIVAEEPHTRVPADRGVKGTRADVEMDIVMGLAGRAAEEVIDGEVTWGAQEDLKACTRIALALHGRMGLGHEGLLHVSEGGCMSPAGVEAARATLDECYARALELVRSHRGNIERVAQALLREGFLDGDEVKALMLSPPPLARPLPGARGSILYPAPGLPRSSMNEWGRCRCLVCQRSKWTKLTAGARSRGGRRARVGTGASVVSCRFPRSDRYPRIGPNRRGIASSCSTSRQNRRSR